MSKIMHLLAAVLVLGGPALSQPWEKLQTIGDVTIGKIHYRASETRRDPQLEAALVKSLDLQPGEEIRYLYNRVELTPKGQQILVLLTSPSFRGSGGSTMLILQPDSSGYRLITRFTLVNSPVVVPGTSSHGWKDLVWLVRGGGVRSHYATLHFNGTGYPENPSSVKATPPGRLQGEAYLADRVHPEAGLKFVVGSRDQL